MPITLRRITIFPIKSFDGHDVKTAKVLSSGALAGDRRYALKDNLGRYVNGKQVAAIQRIRARFSDDLSNVTLSCDGQSETFTIDPGNDTLANWCSAILDKKCRLVEDINYGFPDDLESPGPTLISTASLSEVSNWFEDMDLDEARKRFRMNLEVDSTIPFWEDQLVTERLKLRRFRVGDIVWQGRGICQRCVVPTRRSDGSEVISGFSRHFSQRRQNGLPDWSPTERFDHFYRLGVNTVLDSVDNGNIVRVGDTVELI